jgi:hypothetical protein
MKLLAFAIVFIATVTVAAQPPTKPARTASYSPSKTAWGDPDLQGTYTDKDENGIPMEKPSQFQGKTLEQVDDSELADIVKERQQRAAAGAAAIGGADTGAGPVHWYEHYDAKNSRAWLVLDPPDGRIPDQVSAVQQRNAARAAARGARGVADSYEDRSLYDRCITRGIVGSMLPVIYGNSFQFVQGPGYVAIRYEMIHETRVIPLTGRPRVSPKLHMLMGDPRGHFDGNTLVVETTNFNGIGGMTNVGIPGSPFGDTPTTTNMKITERFTRTGEDSMDYSMHVEDPEVLTQPWTAGYPMQRDPTYKFFEYACNEDNTAVRNYITTSRYERAQAAKQQKGQKK